VAEVVLFGDAVSEAITVLTAAFAETAADYAAGVKVRNKVPEQSEPIETPYVSVASDGVPGRDWPIAQRSTLRVTCWHDTDAKTHDLAALTQALLLSPDAHSGQMVGCHDLTGPIDTVDDLTGRPMSWFTVRASMQGQRATA
jgi:hypothetical protein